MKKQINQVREFHKTFGHPIINTPTIPNTDRAELRFSLIQEELNELIQAYKDNNLIEIGDALTDLSYVLFGTYIEFGCADLAENMFDLVHKSNMSKSCKNMEEVKQTMNFYKEKGVDTYYKQIDNLYLVYRSADNKALKSINYSPVNLKPTIEGQTTINYSYGGIDDVSLEIHKELWNREQR